MSTRHPPLQRPVHLLCYDRQERSQRDQIVRDLVRYAVTTWTHDKDIQTGTDYARAIEHGIETADNFLFLLSPESVQSEYCQRELTHALRYHKRLIPVLIAPMPEDLLPPALRGLQYLHSQAGGIDEILTVLQQDQSYYEQHKILLVRALQWLAADKQPSFLLRGYNLDNAKTWLQLHQHRHLYPPTRYHHQLVHASETAKGQLSTDVFISYSRKDSDLARRLNLALQQAGKTIAEAQ